MYKKTLIAISAAVLLAGCSSNAAPTSTQPASSSAPASATTQATAPASNTGVDTDVTFESDGTTLFGSFRMPAGATGKVPAALLLAGSGPTDRNGDSTGAEGQFGTLKSMADVLATHGIASLRFDKFGSGKTGVGGQTADQISQQSFDVYKDGAVAALNSLAANPSVDADKILLVGHSEGALVAMQTMLADTSPKPIGLALVEPATKPILDTLSSQITATVTRQVAAGQGTQEVGDQLLAALATAIESIRSTGTVPADIPAELQQVGLSAVNAKALQSEDALDPRVLAKDLPAGLPLLTTCSTKDIQISCADVSELNASLSQTDLDAVTLKNADHILKDVGDAQSTGQEYSQPLPFSTEFVDAFTSWAKAHTG